MYCTITDILKKIDKSVVLELTNDENRSVDLIDLDDTEDVVTERITAAITEACEEADTYLRSQYTLPLEETPVRLKDICVDITVYCLYKRRHWEEIPEGVSDIYSKRLKDLDKIQAGLIDLGVADYPQHMNNEIAVNKTEDSRLFTDSQLDKY